jgi:hypothetical protein
MRKNGVKLKKHIIVKSETVNGYKTMSGMWNNIIKDNVLRRGKYHGLTNMMYHHTCAICSMNLIVSTIALLHGELVEITCDVICGSTVRASVVLVKPFPATESGVLEFPTNLTLMVSIGIVRVLGVTTTPIATIVATTIFLSTLRALVAVTRATKLLFATTATGSSISNQLVSLLLFLLRLLRCEMCLGIMNA